MRRGRACLKDGFQDRLSLFQYLVVPEPQNAIAPRLQPSRTILVLGKTLGVLTSVHLNDQSLLEAEEIDDEGAYRMLPSKPMAGKLSPTKFLPEDPLGVSRVFP